MKINDNVTTEQFFTNKEYRGDDMKEEWRDIDGYEGLYMVSNKGNVKSLNYKKTGKEGILKPHKTNWGYLRVRLCKDGKSKNYLIHRLVAQAFCENPKGYKDVNHKDENKQNNKASNLEWCTSSYNNTYNDRAKKAGRKLRNDPNRSKAVIAIDKITGLILEFPSTHEASRQTKINQGNISNCCTGRQKSAGGFYWLYADEDDDTE